MSVLGLNKKVAIYHYVFDEASLDKILKLGKLLPVNRNLSHERVYGYAERAISLKLKGVSEYNTPLENAEIYWKAAYNLFYRGALNKPYINYGIYFTPIDLAGIIKIKYRFRLDFSKLTGDSVLQISRKVELIESGSRLLQLTKAYTNKVKNKELWDRAPGAHFKYLPQIVNFSNYIKVSRKDLEIL